MKWWLLAAVLAATSLAEAKRAPGEIFTREEACAEPGVCAPCQATDSGNLAGMAVGAALVIGSAWWRRRK